jgi:outer membrane protein OmpA-like peptidoglycan-associated protein/tetratricopeptide (TPR) repeat protein
MKNKYLITAIAISLVFGSCTSIRKAERLYQGFEYSKATPVYEKIASTSNKNTTLALTRLGDINRLSSHFEQSADWYKKAIETNEAKPETYINYGQVLRSLGRYEEAITQFEKYTQLNPSDNRAVLYAEYCKQFLNKDERIEFYDVVNAKGLNSPYSDFSPVMMNDLVVFTSDRSSGTSARLYGWTGAYYLDLYKAGKPDASDPEKEVTPKPEPLSTTLNMAYHDGPASFSPDNKTIYFTRAYRKKGDLDSSQFYTNKLKIFTSKLEGESWSKPEPFYLNSEEYSVGHPAISPDGNTMYFVSDIPGGNGGTDIYSVNLVDGNWSNLNNLGTDVNTFGNEMFPFVDSNGTLYFASDGWPGVGSLDIFKSSFSNNKWSKPENLKEPVNSSADDFGFYKSSANQAMFSSNRQGGLGSDDIYIGTVIKYADSVLISGLVKDRNTGEPLTDATVLMWNTANENVLILKTNQNGEYSTICKPGNSYIFKSVKSGYTTDCLTVTLPQFTREDKHQNRDLLLVKLKVDEIFKLENVYYDFDKWNIRPDAATELNKLVDFLNLNPGVSIELGSHTDCRGTDKYNERLAERRAESAVKYIIEKGISKNIITAKGYGESKLVNKCSDGVECTEQEHQDNRRTEIKITGLATEAQEFNVEPLESLKNGQVIKLADLQKDFFSNCSEDKAL